MGSNGQRGGSIGAVDMVKLVLTNERLVLPVSIYDNKLDRESINPRKQAFEKMVSGMCRLLPALPDKGLS
jgi:hexokinase